MEQQVSQALGVFTRNYIELWRRETGHPPASDELYGVASPCIVATQDCKVHWLPQTPAVPVTLDGVERALEIQLHPDIHSFFTSQFAGDMTARFEELECTLLQAWSEDDFVRLQENLICHLLTQKRLKLPPTLFLATTNSEMSLISLCNLSGEVVLEEFGTRQRRVLASGLVDFLHKLLPLIP
ncbi:SecY-interacting protein [Dickeya sp. CFBP 2040]|uniref:SecY-interacting protein n=1 Tax=Dickeya sp. CFBP 2040 TaxID=2718531 RepID=UPI001445882A|nr:SecY-interacting protein [Dickeya sp. CFBP 2040]NKI73188.1 SecY-interacting protein [Dickeya sp. CFBP 2040]